MKNIVDIANKIKNAGGNLYLVGGAVRDELLGKQNKDHDFCVTGINASRFEELFPDAYKRGKSFEVFDIDGNEFAIARKERKVSEGHKGFDIITNENISIEEDLARRDITINAIAKDVITGQLIDPFNGVQDIRDKVIRATTERFKEDPLRVYRVARFAALLGFEVEPKTIGMMSSLKSELASLSKDRVVVELSKGLLSNKPSIFFNVLKSANVLDVHFKEIYDLIGALQPENFHPEGDAYNHTMIALDKSVDFTDNLDVRFAVLVHDLGKGITPPSEYPHHYGHEEKGVELVGNLCNRIKAPTSWEKSGKTACREHMRGGIFYKMRSSKQVEFIERVDRSYLGLDGLQIVVYCDKLSSRNVDKGSIEFAKIGKKCLEAVDGKFVRDKYNIAESREFGALLRSERIAWMKKYMVKDDEEKELDER